MVKEVAQPTLQEVVRFMYEIDRNLSTIQIGIDKNVILPALATGKGGGISIMLEPRPPFLEVVRLMKGLLASGPDRGC